MANPKHLVIEDVVQLLEPEVILPEPERSAASALVTGDGRVLHRADLQRVPIPEGFCVNLSEINKGGAGEELAPVRCRQHTHRAWLGLSDGLVWVETRGGRHCVNRWGPRCTGAGHAVRLVQGWLAATDCGRDQGSR